MMELRYKVRAGTKVVVQRRGCPPMAHVTTHNNVFVDLIGTKRTADGREFYTFAKEDWRLAVEQTELLISDSGRAFVWLKSL